MREPKLEVALTKCFFCGKDDKIVMNSKLTKQHADNVKKVHGKVIDTDPCNACSEYMDQGIIIIGIQDNEGGKENPYRTGFFCVVTEDGMKRMLQDDEDTLNATLKSRMIYIEETAYVKMGLLQMAESC